MLAAVLVALTLLSPACRSDPAQDVLRDAASSHSFSLFRWHVTNLPLKLLSSITGRGALPPPEERKAVVDEFFALQSDMAGLERQLARAIATGSGPAEIEALEAELAEVRRDYASLARHVEAIIEREVTDVLVSQGFGFRLARGRIVFPPVLFVFQPAPNMLAVSPRDRIRLLGYELLSPSMTLADFELVEERVDRTDTLSGLVLSPGGLASYPTIVDESARFHRTLYVVAHEWVHQYLIFYPLGRAWFQGGIGRQINEAVADIIGYEVADEIYRRYGYEPPPRVRPPAETGFDFAAEMRETRLVTGHLLEEGRIDEAEQYMEERRLMFVAEGYNIRKLNQAYFAIRDPYALSPGSISPLGGQMQELRGYYDDLNGFARAMRGVTTHEQVLSLLDAARAGR